MDINDIINYRNKGVNIAVIIVAIAVGLNIYKKQVTIIESLKQAKEMEINKSMALGGISELEKQVKLYKDFVNKKDPLTLIKTFNKVARAIEVNIASLKPDKPQDLPMYVRYPYFMTITSRSFYKLGKFISMLESSPEVFIVNTAVIKPIGTVGEDSANDCLSMDLVVSTIIFK
jgi:hypothetical protein